MKAVEALRAELEEEEQALEGSHEGSVSEGAQSHGPSSQAGSASPQQAAAVGHDDGAHSDKEDDASNPDVTCALTQPARNALSVPHAHHSRLVSQISCCASERILHSGVVVVASTCVVKHPEPILGMHSHLDGRIAQRSGNTETCQVCNSVQNCLICHYSTLSRSQQPYACCRYNTVTAQPQEEQKAEEETAAAASSNGSSRL